MGLVGLYACNVRRLGSKKRIAANFLGCFALSASCIVVASLVLIASLLLFVGFVWVVCWVVVGGSFSLRTV